jgi:hypothetical protein
VGDVCRELQRQPRLAGTARTGQRQQPGVREQLAGVLDLLLAPDEARQLRRQVVGPAVERADRRELRPQPVDVKLADPLRPEVLEPMLAEPVEGDASRQRARDAVRRRLGQEDLAAVGRSRDPGRAVNVGADVLAVAVERSVAGVEAHPDAQLDPVGPRLGRQLPLGLDRGRDSRLDRREDREESVAFGLVEVA